MKQHYEELLSKIDGLIAKGNTVVAIEGGSASGKTTLAKMLSDVYGCTVFHMDDFFLRPEQRTKGRYEEIGGNVDRERFLSEVLIPLKNGEPIKYRKFDCSSMTLTDEETVIPKKLTIVEGAYSMHPELAEYYDLSVFLEISPEFQRGRILRRNGEKMAERFFNEWIPLENIYFEKTDIKSRCDLTVKIK
ncbi:MAG: hypothetical protein IJ404_05420 [Clostridia bacterium]|nr:hypothetical protein [Clostridia bacterium]